MSSLYKGAKDLFIAALEHEGAEREAFLANACGDDTALREEVESLLRFHQNDSTGLPTPPTAPPEPPPPRTFQPGFVFGMRYRMVTRLGKGGMGDVWRADDLMLDTPVALKLIRSTSQAGRERLLQEVRLARRVTHPAVVRVFDVGEADDEVFFSMELVEGQDLAAVMRHAGRLAPGRVIENRPPALCRPARRSLRGRAAPRPEAGQHPGGSARPRSHHRLRHRGADRRVGDPRSGHAQVHGARAADAWRGDLAADRPLLPRRAALRAGHGAAPDVGQPRGLRRSSRSRSWCPA
jgi:hypothetical protein